VDDDTPLNLSDLGIEEEKDIGVGELFGALFKETAKAVGDGVKSTTKKEEGKKKGGFLGGMFSGETVQENDNPNRFANPEASDDEGEMGLLKKKD